MATRVKVLLTGPNPDELRRYSGPLLDRGLGFEVQLWDDDVVDLVLTEGFDAIVVRYPVLGMPLARFVSAVRATASKCRHAGLVLLTSRDHLEHALKFVGHGVNRALPADAPPGDLAQAIAELLAVAPRVEVKAPTRIQIRLQDRPVAAFCQTVNISASGMLVRGFDHYPVGTMVDFELNLPGEERPLRGAAEVSRHSNTVREGVSGFGVRFLTFEAADRRRLYAYLEDRTQ